MLLTRKINSYVAVLVLTIFGSAATLLIVHIANTSTYTVLQHEQAQYIEYVQ